MSYFVAKNLRMSQIFSNFVVPNQKIINPLKQHKIMALTTFYVVLPESAPVSTLHALPSYVTSSALDAFSEARKLSEFAHREHPEQALHHACYRIFECETYHHMRVVGYTAYTSDGWIVALK